MLGSVAKTSGRCARPVMLSEPVVGVAIAAIVLGQPLTPAEVIGGLAILLAAATPAPSW